MSDRSIHDRIALDEAELDQMTDHDDLVVGLRGVVYGALSHGLIKQELMLPQTVRAAIRDDIVRAIGDFIDERINILRDTN